MAQFIIVELEDGLIVVELLPGQTPEDAAVSQGGVVVDDGPYSTLEDAEDAMTDLQDDEQEERA
jgi:hypothetical protein